jgi:hydroxypyruvate isomerase
LIDNLCTILGRETPGTEGFRINIDHAISEAEARASQSEAIPVGETPEQRKREFHEALRKILRVAQDRDSSNKDVWTEALHLLDNPRVRVPKHNRPKDPPKR